MELLEHNKKTVEEAENYIDNKKDVCIVNPCGSGKTYVMMQLLQDYPDKSATIVTKQANAKEYYYSKSDIFRKTNIVTYNKLHTDFKNGVLDEYNSSFLFLDESQYIGANKWQEAILEIKKQFNPIMVGFTATTQRYEQQGTNESIVTEYFDNNTAGNYTLTSLYNKGLFKKPDVILSLYTLENEINKRKEEILNSDLAEKQKTKLNTELDKTVDIWRNNYAPAVLLQKHLPKYMYKESCNRIVVYSPTYQLLQEHYDSICTMLQTIFPEKKIEAYKYAIKNSSSEKEYTQFLKEDDTYIKVLFSIDKIMETIHIDDLNILIMLRPSVSNRIIIQQYGRVNRIGADNTAVIFDFVSNSLKLGKFNPYAYTIGKTKQKNHTSTLSLSNINLSYITKINKLFESIDNTLNSTKYTYKGYTGGLSFLCHIFSCDTKKVKDCLNKGYTLEQSMALCKTKNAKPTISENTNDTVTCPKEIMDEITMLLTKYFDILLQGNDAYDEDIKQELYLWAFSNYKKFTFDGVINKCRFQSVIRRQYANICKNNILDKDLSEDYLCTNEMESCSTDMSTVIENKVFLQQFQKELCNILLSRLTKKEVIVIVSRFGLQDGCAKTLEQVAAELGVTRERVRQIETKALRKLRYYYTARILSEDFNVFVSNDITNSTHTVDYLDALNKYTSFNVNNNVGILQEQDQKETHIQELEQKEFNNRFRQALKEKQETTKKYLKVFMFDIDTDIVDMYMQQTILKVQNGGVKSIGKVYLPNLDYIDNSILKTIVPFHYFCTNSVKINIIYGLLYFYTYEKDPILYSMLYYIFLCITNNMKMRTDIKNYILQELNSVRMAYSDMYNEYYMPVLFYKFISDCVLKLC